ncbi:hypothetical protein [Phocaeicola salanitronis]|uniref:hypothetical protein n=1 Tax=Phocaeicola salanitronis TaxID=376805 RepID=UPI0025A4A18B|nr:hypothetical protein [Phocaeicola salanitronis]MDM8306586.1 hypothetical protein [Phocaeicola salanitronis]
MIKYCPTCHTNYGETDKNFCTSDGTRLVAQTPAEAMIEEISVVKNKIIWNIPMGEVAYRIDEKEIETLVNASGIIVDEGVTAYIYIDGKLASEIHGGNYDFVSKEELERKLNARFGGMSDKLKKMWKVITRFWVGTTLNEQFQQHESLEKFSTMEELQTYIMRDVVCSIVLKVDKEFPLTFEHNIQTSQYHGTVGLNVSAQITDFRQFIQTFMLGGQNKRVSNQQIKILFKDAVNECLRGENFAEGRVSAETIRHLQFRLQGVVEQMNTGISIIRVNDCCVTSEDLNRLRELDREIYLSEEELDRLHRINLIKNRLNDSETQQRIEQARGELGVRRILDEINRDNILADEEMEAFQETIINTRRLRQARNQEELDESIGKIRKAQILREEDINLLVYEVTEQKYKRETVFSLMQLNDSIKRNRIIQDATQESELSAMKHLVGLQRIKDLYNDEKFQLELSQKEKEYQLNFQVQKGNIQLIDELQAIEEKKNAAAHARQMDILNTLGSHDENMLRIKSGMSAEQLTAEQLATLTPEAQEAYMSAAGDRARAQAEREKTELMKELRRDDLDRIERLAMHAMDTTNGVALREKQRADEYKEDLHRTEDRLDRQQEQTMRYTVGNSQASYPNVRQSASVVATPPLAAVASSKMVKCPKCGKENDLSEGQFCGYCKASLI